MLFNSPEFLFLFLPITLIVYFLLGKYSPSKDYPISWLVFSSLFFYGWWEASYLLLIIGSMAFNYSFGIKLQSILSLKVRKFLLGLGIVINLGTLVYFKYMNFFVEQGNAMLGTNIYIEKIVLPLAISFFTFQQIAYLVDSYRFETSEHSFLHYALFVSFFPQLIAGPIVHHKSVLPQFKSEKVFKFGVKPFFIGLCIFTLGLFKKMVISDSIAMYSSPVFNLASEGASIDIALAWSGALAYTFQLYFDFSGYSDMAIGLALMMGIRLPINFNSPYKATSIVDFWRRWHITLSTFLRDYLYIALGGNRNGVARRYTNLLLTMLIGGFWHGAGWTFIIWGGLHGSYLILNQLYRFMLDKLNISFSGSVYNNLCWFITFISVIVSWVFFRAESVDVAVVILKGMVNFDSFPHVEIWQAFIFDFKGWGVSILQIINGKPSNTGHSAVLLIVTLLFACKYLPNSLAMINKIFTINLPKSIESSSHVSVEKVGKSFAYATFPMCCGILFAWCVLNMNRVSEFLYFQF